MGFRILIGTSLHLSQYFRPRFVRVSSSLRLIVTICAGTCLRQTKISNAHFQVTKLDRFLSVHFERKIIDRSGGQFLLKSLDDGSVERGYRLHHLLLFFLWKSCCHLLRPLSWLMQCHGQACCLACRPPLSRRSARTMCGNMLQIPEF